MQCATRYAAPDTRHPLAACRRDRRRRIRYGDRMLTFLALVLSAPPGSSASSETLVYDDPKPQFYGFELRASQLDRRAKAYPELGFFLTKDGKPADVEIASVDTRVPPRGKLVIWLMAPKREFFEIVNGYGLHVIQPHYARHWFGKICQEDPVGETCRGDARLEAATGEDHSDQMSLAKPDGMAERARQMVIHLARKNPQGGWGYFLDDQKQLRWEHVILSGASHGSTTAARFAKHQRVSRVVCFAGPRDQLQSWQSLESATPANRIFGFSHVEDSGWKADHYCRSWELMGLAEYGPIVDVDQAKPPYGNTRRLVTAFDVGVSERKKRESRAHSSVSPGSYAAAKDGDAYRHAAVWEYLFTHPVDEVGMPDDLDPDCEKDQRKS